MSSKVALRKMAESALANVPSWLVEPVLIRAVGAPVCVWDTLKVDQLVRVYVFSRTAAMVFAE